VVDVEYPSSPDANMTMDGRAVASIIIVAVFAGVEVKSPWSLVAEN